MAGAYVHMTTAIVHCFFYCHIQPTLMIFVPVNFTIFLVMMKYILLRRCKIPELTEIEVFQFANFSATFGAVFYGIGSSFFLIAGDNKFEFAKLLPSILCLGLWFVASLDPFNFMGQTVKWFLKEYDMNNEIKEQLNSDVDDHIT